MTIPTAETGENIMSQLSIEASRSARYAIPGSGCREPFGSASTVSPSLSPSILGLLGQASRFEAAAWRLQESYTGKTLPVMDTLQAMRIPRAMTHKKSSVVSSAATSGRAAVSYIEYSAGMVEIPKVAPYIWSVPEPRMHEPEQRRTSFVTCPDRRYQLALGPND